MDTNRICYFWSILRQRSNLSALLLILFIHDQLECIDSKKCIVANYINVFASVMCIVDCLALQKELNV